MNRSVSELAHVYQTVSSDIIITPGTFLPTGVVW